MNFECVVLALVAVVIEAYAAKSSALQVDLLDSTTSETLDWVTYSTAERSSRRGWREASYANNDGDISRVYTVCDVASASVDNWLRTPYIRREDASRLYIEVRFTMRKCTKYPSPGRLQQCKESFKLLYYEAESDFANSMMPTWDEETYRHIDVIAADKVFTDNNNALINTEVRSISAFRSGVYFAFYDRGSCLTLLSVRVYYITCPAVSVNFAQFPNTTTGAELTAIVQVDGRCVENAIMDQKPSYLCKADGSWYYSTGRCLCLSGFEPDGDAANGHLHENLCKACPSGTFKWQMGSDFCQPCPENSQTMAAGSFNCQCLDGYFRSPSDSPAMPCTRPPSAVQNLSAVFMSHSVINLSWSRPRDTGGRADLRYRVECITCGSHVDYIPAQSMLNFTRVSLVGLASSTQYKIIVFAENGVSLVSGIHSSSEILLTTESAVPSKVRNVRITSFGSDHISLSWDVPDTSIEAYEVQSWKDSDRPVNATATVVNSPNITFYHLMQQSRYSFLVRGRTTKGWGEFSDVIYATTAHVPQLHEDNPTGIVVGSAIGVVICLTIVVLMVTLFARRCRSERCGKIVIHSDKPSTVMIPLFTPPGTIRSYIDPHTYEDPHQAVREFTKEIDMSLITIESVIGGGEFGDVCKGRLKTLNRGELAVAIKTLKPGASDKNRLDFLTEASIMGQFDDPNVIFLEGVVTKWNPIMIVTELMENGSLDIFLRSNDGLFTVFQLLGMIRGIASGMRYLSEMGYVHRDLAARNILINSQLVCKVADFGLSREIESFSYESDGAYTMKGGKIPVRWTAPEAISYHKFTSSSDVWSYGVVVWEVMSYGERPYWNWSNQDVISAVEKDFRLPPPMDCPESIYQLMLDCWQRERSQRPKFSAIVPTLDRLIRTPELLRQIAIPRQCDYLDSINVRLSCDIDEPVCNWLRNIKMDRYENDFRSAGILSMEDVARLSLKDLVAIGILLVGHQKKILNAVQMLRADFSMSLSSRNLLQM